MFLRTFSLTLGALALTACEDDISAEPEGPEVECAIGPGAELTSTCAFERISPKFFVIHRPDGGFRKFSQGEGPEGFLISVADGAEPIVFQRIDSGAGLIEFGLADEAYRIETSLVLPEAAEAAQAGSDE